MNARLYDPRIGRFLSPDNYITDPENPQSYNRYSYVLNNPLKYVDPTGNTPIDLYHQPHIDPATSVFGGSINFGMNAFDFADYSMNHTIEKQISFASYYFGPKGVYTKYGGAYFHYINKFKSLFRDINRTGAGTDGTSAKNEAVKSVAAKYKGIKQTDHMGCGPANAAFICSVLGYDYIDYDYFVLNFTTYLASHKKFQDDGIKILYIAYLMEVALDLTFDFIQLSQFNSKLDEGNVILSIFDTYSTFSHFASIVGYYTDEMGNSIYIYMNSETGDFDIIEPSRLINLRSTEEVYPGIIFKRK